MHRIAVLLLAMLLTLVAAACTPRAQIIPAKFAQGVITQLDRDTGMFRIGTDAYQMTRGRGGLTFLARFHPGEAVEVTFIESQGRREAITMRRLDLQPPNCILPPCRFVEE